ncbi:MAG: hypothetical protein K9L32_13485 [Chromatiaceae bacterium]|nr:hypothetical protein [Chromatiaceae bacterium]
METLSSRSTYTVDPETASLIEQLSASWQVSKTEVIHRSIRIALANEPDPALTPKAVLEYYRAHSVPRDWQETARIVDTLRLQRHEDDQQRTSRHD